MRMRTSCLATAALATLALAACGDSAAFGASSPKPPSAGAATQAQATATSESKTFRDWYAVCDNGQACAAYTGGSTGWILVSQDAGPEAQPVVRFGMWGGEGPMESRLTLVIDGKRHRGVAGPADTGSALVAAGEVRAVLAELAAGKTLSITNGAESVALPVAGSSASLLWIDERQRRLDTVTALIRRGDAPASRVPSAPALPIVTPAPAVSQAGFDTPAEPLNDENATGATPSAALEALLDVQECRRNLDFNEYVQKAVTAARLDASTELWGIPCDSGAYNASYAFYLTGPNGSAPRLATFPGSGGMSDEATDPWLVNPVYDPETRTLMSFAKARGLGDCGTMQTWTWTGRAFVLSREQVMQDCWGMVSDFWPTTYRTR